MGYPRKANWLLLAPPPSRQHEPRQVVPQGILSTFGVQPTQPKPQQPKPTQGILSTFAVQPTPPKLKRDTQNNEAVSCTLKSYLTCQLSWHVSSVYLHPTFVLHYTYNFQLHNVMFFVLDVCKLKYSLCMYTHVHLYNVIAHWIHVLTN